MRYVLKEKVEKLKELAKKHPAITVDFDHASTMLFERFGMHGHKSVINLTHCGVGAKSVHDFYAAVLDEPSYSVVVNDFGDEQYVTDLMPVILSSMARIVNESGDYEIIGPIGDIIRPPAKPAIESKVMVELAKGVA